MFVYLSHLVTRPERCSALGMGACSHWSTPVTWLRHWPLIGQKWAASYARRFWAEAKDAHWSDSSHPMGFWLLGSRFKISYINLDFTISNILQLMILHKKSQKKEAKYYNQWLIKVSEKMTPVCPTNVDWAGEIYWVLGDRARHQRGALSSNILPDPPSTLTLMRDKTFCSALWVLVCGGQPILMWSLTKEEWFLIFYV